MQPMLPDEPQPAAVLSVEGGKVIHNFDVREAIERAGVPLASMLATLPAAEQDKLRSRIDSGEDLLVYWTNSAGQSIAAALLREESNPPPPLFKSTLPIGARVIFAALWCEDTAADLNAFASATLGFAESLGDLQGIAIMTNGAGPLAGFAIAGRIGDWSLFERALDVPGRDETPCH
jgi:hypothetical protein